MESSGNQLEPVDRLAEEFIERQRQGERLTIEDYARRYPDLAEEIREVFPALLMMDQVAPADSDLESRSPRESPANLAQEQIGDYRLIREIGRGGMGIVYEAEQQSLRRRVALKVLLSEMAASTRSMERFQREARAAARMHHTNIVPVFEVGQDGSTAFYAMQLIQGQGLDLVIDDLRRLRREHSSRLDGKLPLEHDSRQAHSIAASLFSGEFRPEKLGEESGSGQAPSSSVRNRQARELTPTEPVDVSSTASAVLPGESDISTAETNRARYFRCVAQIGMQTADALAYAHLRGIIHRDIKPSNLILDAGGVVWVTDFGLAKTDDEGMTHTGDILGTMRYMSPERFRGQCDVRADIYSLGLTLYELLVLKPAFESPDRLRLIEMVRETEPATPRSIDSRIPRDLETIVLKAIDKDPKRRYLSADELSEDLRRFVDDEPIKARRISSPERLIRWSRRNKVVAASATTVAALLFAAAVASTIAAGVFREERAIAVRAQQEAVEAQQEAERAQQETADALAEANRQKNIAEESRQAAEYSSYASIVRLTLSDLDEERPMVARQQLLAAPVAYRNWEWGYLVARAWPPQFNSPPALRSGLSGVEYWASAPIGAIKALDHERHTRISASAFSTDGTRIVTGTASVNERLPLWDVRTGEKIGGFAGLGGLISSVAFSHGDEYLAVSEVSGDVALFDVDTQEQRWIRKDLSNRQARNMWFSPDDKFLLFASSNGVVWVLETTAEGRTVQTFEQHTVAVQSIRFRASGDGFICLSADINGSIWSWELKTGGTIAPPTSLEPQRKRSSALVKISPSARELAIAYDDGAIVLLDQETGQEQLIVDGRAQVHDLVFGHDGSCLIVAYEQIVEIFDRTGKSVASLPTRARLASDASIAVSADGSQIATNSTDGITNVWAPVVPDKSPQRRLPDAHDDYVLQAAFSGDSTRVVTASYDKTVRVWDAATQQLIIEFPGHEHELLKADFSPDGALVASTDCRGVVRVWDVETGKERFSPVEADDEFSQSARSERGLRGEIANFTAVFSSSLFFEDGLVVNDKDGMVVLDPTGQVCARLEESPPPPPPPPPNDRLARHQPRRQARSGTYRYAQRNLYLGSEDRRQAPHTFGPRSTGLRREL